MISQAKKYILGLDIGSNSIGWAMIGCAKGRPSEILRAGVRCFDGGVSGDIEAGRDISRSLERREARTRRRQIYRRTRRLSRIANILQESGLLLEGRLHTSEERHQFFTKLDKAISKHYLNSIESPEEKRQAANVLYYKLRAKGLDEKLDLHELGRVFYHLSQRRGFLSNRRKQAMNEENAGEVKKAIIDLDSCIRGKGYRTLGEYFADCNPEDARIRQRWTSRQMYEHEFNEIWKRQKNHYPSILTPELKQRLAQAIFFQRPLRSQKGLVGTCNYEKGARRAPIASLEFQKFRYLQKLNDLEIQYINTGEVRNLNHYEREILITCLEKNERITFSEMKKQLGLLKNEVRFNLEEGGEKKIYGNVTATRLGALLGHQWQQMSTKKKDQLINDVRSINKEDTLKKRAIQMWGLDVQAAEEIKEISLEDGYCTLSRRALKKIIPELEKGEQYGSIITRLYGHRRTQIYDHLPSIDKTKLSIRNPAVHRTLTELKKIVNALIREHGKPYKIRIELARDLKLPRKIRKQRYEQMREMEKERDNARQRLLKDGEFKYPTGTDILKIRLADECGWECPYTGRNINMSDLIGPQSKFDIEHIFPYHRCFDDSFANKTLCYADENRHIKRNRLPFEAYGHSPEWGNILERVKKFRGRFRNEKLRRFRTQNLENVSDFISRQLNDARYASTLAAKYLGFLYGGLVDNKHIRRIQASKGAITAQIRNAWQLNTVLGDGPSKNREDHRHHAIDAVIIALTDADIITQMSNIAEESLNNGKRRWWHNMPCPWPNFINDVKDTIDQIIVSHRPSMKVNGPLHEETIYSSIDDKGYLHIRKPLSSLSKREVEEIVDPKIREIVKDVLNGKEPKNVFKDRKNHPYLITRHGFKIPIHKARIKKKEKSFTVGKGNSSRRVVNAKNHHIELTVFLGENGNNKGKGYVVSTFEAMQRVRKGQPIIKQNHGQNEKFLFSLGPKETVLMKNRKGEKSYFNVIQFWEESNGTTCIVFKPVNDANKNSERKSLIKYTVNTLLEADCEKVGITPLGEAKRAR